MMGRRRAPLEVAIIGFHLVYAELYPCWIDMDRFDLRRSTRGIPNIMNPVGGLDEGLARRIGVRGAQRIRAIRPDDTPFDNGYEHAEGWACQPV